MMRQMREATKPIMLFTAAAFVALMVFQWGMDITGISSGSYGEIIGKSRAILEVLAKVEQVARTDSVVLITGGFGGIGQTVARDLLQNHRANVVLLSRGGVPARDEWEAYLMAHASHDATAKRIRALQELEGLGGKVIADIPGLLKKSMTEVELAGQVESRSNCL